MNKKNGPSIKTGKATMTDVAKRAGVSAATVARVIYGNGYVKSATRDAVNAALEITGYRPNVVARSLRTQRSFTIGMVVSESRLNAFHPYVAHVVQMEALARGYTVLTLNNNANPEMERAGVQRFLDQHVDAVIFCAAIVPENVRTVAKAGIPTVQIERESVAAGGLVLVDPTNGMDQTIDHLWSLGHRDIAYIGGLVDASQTERPPEEIVEARRLDSFVRSLGRCGIDVQPEYVKRGPYYRNTSRGTQPGYELMQELLDLHHPPTAVVCGSDLLAASALQVIHVRGLTVPGDISIVGYDDSMAEILTPPLSSIAQPIEDLGRIGVELAIAAINSSDAPLTRHVLSTQFIQRQSTGSVRKK